MRGPKEKKERALGEKLNLKAERSGTTKSAVARKPYRPGQHGQSRRPRAGSDFAIQLKEKQKFKISYNLKENQLRDIFNQGLKVQGKTREKVTELLERRLENTVYRLGFAPSRLVARSAINHGHIFVNNRKVTSPSFQVSIGDVITINPNSQNKGFGKAAVEAIKKYEAPAWLILDPAKVSGRVGALPTDVNLPFDLNLVVEYYAK